MLLGDHSLVRRRDDADRIVLALGERAQGAGYRRIATVLGMRKLAQTVRGWLRAFARAAEAIRAHFTRWAYALDPGLGPIAPRGNPLGDAVEAMAVAARAAVQRHGPIPASARVARLSGGALLCHTSYPLPAPPGL
ncbi:MAG: helix-turn-helix domain-containing protein [Acidimicrobiales bacterium]